MPIDRPHIVHQKISSRPAWLEKFRELPAAMVADAQGGEGILDPAIRNFTPGLHLAGFALTVCCEHDDNLIVHKAISMIQAGEVLIVEVEPQVEGEYGVPYAVVGEVLASAAKQRGAAGIVIDGCIRDQQAIVQTRIPVFARGVSIRGSKKEKLGTINHTVTIGGILTAPGDLIIGDDDGLIRIASQESAKVLERVEEMRNQESGWKEALKHGQTTIELLGLDRILKEMGAEEG